MTGHRVESTTQVLDREATHTSRLVYVLAVWLSLDYLEIPYGTQEFQPFSDEASAWVRPPDIQILGLWVGIGSLSRLLVRECSSTANFRTNIMDFRGFDSSVILILRGGIPRPIGNSPESLSQAILAGIMLVGKLGVV